MADQKKSRKSVTRKKSSSRVTVTNRSTAGKSPAPKSSKGKKSAKPAAKGHKSGKKQASNFARTYLPYILAAFALFLTVCYITNLFGKDAAPIDHPMGLFGYYICRALFGCLSWVAYLIPAVLIVLVIFWQRYFESGRATGKVILSAVLVLLLAALSHVVLCAVDANMATRINPVKLFTLGTSYTGGGVLGGFVGFILYWTLRLPGTIVLTIVAVPLILMCLVGVTPNEVFGKLWKQFKEARAARLEEDDDDYDDDDYDDYDDEEDEEDTPPPARNRRADRSNAKRRDDRGVIRLDPETGEVLDDDAPQKPSRRAKKAARAEEENDNAVAPLPLFDSNPAPAKAEAPESDLPWRNDAEVVTPKPISAHTPPPDEDEDDGTDAMQVGFDDEPEEDAFVPTRISGKRVNYEVVTDGETEPYDTILLFLTVGCKTAGKTEKRQWKKQNGRVFAPFLTKRA